MRPKLPIEPLDEAAWQRVEDRVMAEPPASLVPPPAPSRPWTIAAALALALVALAVLAWPKDEPPAIATTRVTTDRTASVVRLGEARLEVLASSTVIAVGSDAGGWEVALARGGVTCEVPPRRDRPPFVVLVDDVRVEVVGTSFTVEREPLAVAVHRGAVRVIAPDGAWDVGVGQRWTREEPVAASESAPVVPMPVREAEPEPPSPAEASAPRVRPRTDPRAEFERASQLEATDPTRSDEAYARVERAGGPWAANALFARGRLAAERDDRARARALLRRYLRLHPSGPNAADAHRLILQLEARAPVE